MPYKVYLADDSITIQKVVELTLSEEDFEVTAFGDGESALDAARKAAPDIILADIVMPRMDGYQLSAAVKRDPALKNIPVLLLAGTFENFDEGLAASSFADGHIIKPFESSELVNKVKELVERKARTAPEPLDEHVSLEEAAPLVAVPFDEPEETLQAEPVDDLWSVVDMQTEDQPLAGASEVMSYFTAPSKAEEEKLPWDDLPLDAMVDEDEEPEEAYLADEHDEIFMAVEAPEEAVDAVEAIEADEVVEAEEVVEAVEADEFMEAEEAAFPAAPSAGAAPEPDDLHKLVTAKVREVISRMSAEAAEKVAWEVMPDVAEKVVWEVVPAVVEKIVWDVVPGLAEQIILKEIEKLKAES